MNSTPYPRITPWVGRLIIANAVVLLLLLTVFTSPALQSRLVFDPAHAFARPWTFITYMFVHAGFLHVLFNMIALFFFGPPVEERLGPSGFIKYYLACGLGGAALSFVFALHTMIVGASGAIYGIMLAYALWWPDSPIYIWGILPVKAKWLLLAFIGLDLFFALAPGGYDGTAHFAHLGGVAAGLLYLKAGGLGVAVTTRAKKLFRPKLTVIPGAGPAAAPPKPPRRPRVAEEERILDELDRVLDKISRSGMGSLTTEERALLDEASKRYRQN